MTNSVGFFGGHLLLSFRYHHCRLVHQTRTKSDGFPPLPSQQISHRQNNARQSQKLHRGPPPQHMHSRQQSRRMVNNTPTANPASTLSISPKSKSIPSKPGKHRCPPRRLVSLSRHGTVAALIKTNELSRTKMTGFMLSCAVGWWWDIESSFMSGRPWFSRVAKLD